MPFSSTFTPGGGSTSRDDHLADTLIEERQLGRRRVAGGAVLRILVGGLARVSQRALELGVRLGELTELAQRSPHVQTSVGTARDLQSRAGQLEGRGIVLGVEALLRLLELLERNLGFRGSRRREAGRRRDDEREHEREKRYETHQSPSGR